MLFWIWQHNRLFLEIVCFQWNGLESGSHVTRWFSSSEMLTTFYVINDLVPIVGRSTLSLRTTALTVLLCVLESSETCPQPTNTTGPVSRHRNLRSGSKHDRHGKTDCRCLSLTLHFSNIFYIYSRIIFTLASVFLETVYEYIQWMSIKWLKQFLFNFVSFAYLF